MSVPTAEELAGRLLRLLRQGRRWSQQEVADQMKSFGYNWQQSTVGKVEAAQRPLRLNELADLAIVFGVAITELLEPQLLIDGEDDVEDLRKEIARLEAEQDRLEAEHAAAVENARAAGYHMADLGAELARVKASLETMRRWHPAASEKGEAG